MDAPAPIVVRPDGAGPHPGVVLGAEAYGVNEFIVDVAEQLAAAGYVALVPDYYEGGGPADREAYEDFTEVVGHIAELDFTRASDVIVGALDQLRAMPEVDASRLAVWGYCTGGTLAWLAACRRALAASVLFFPSQPSFEALGPRTPVHPVDLLWMLDAPTLLLYGDEDVVMPPDALADLRARIERWGVPAELRIYPGAGHAFTVPWGPLRNAAAADAATRDAFEFLDAAFRNPTRP
jgi:carboxymethylenebutenolidase